MLVHKHQNKAATHARPRNSSLKRIVRPREIETCACYMLHICIKWVFCSSNTELSSLKADYINRRYSQLILENKPEAMKSEIVCGVLSLLSCACSRARAVPVTQAYMKKKLSLIRLGIGWTVGGLHDASQPLYRLCVSFIHPVVPDNILSILLFLNVNVAMYSSAIILRAASFNQPKVWPFTVYILSGHNFKTI